MTQAMTSASFPPGAQASKALRTAARFWFVTAVAGQSIFAIYIAAFYGGTALRGDLAAWNDVLPMGVVEGDAAHNAAMVGHILLAFLITLTGALQLTPQVRAGAPRFHRWTGRAYLSGAAVASLTGLYLVWTRRSPTDVLVNDIAISINAALILLCAGMTLRHALKRRLDQHHRWALRLFLVVSGVWFFRVALMLWIAANQGPVGVGDHLEGPVGVSIAYGQYLVPLAVLELYLRARDGGGPTQKMAMAVGLAVLTLAMACGIVAATAFMWAPRL